MTLTLSQDGSQVTGSGQINSGGTAVALTANGTFAAPSVSLNLSATGFEAMNYTGSLSGNTIAGTINGSGFSNLNLTLTRQ
ncbi:MAG TPA: hypothetical protein VHB25_20585 [Gemmatimonadaceae bacterium]|nr:hypothetical protein [Gemmatimonadaceae bacterium]